MEALFANWIILSNSDCVGGVGTGMVYSDVGVVSGVGVGVGLGVGVGVGHSSKSVAGQGELLSRFVSSIL